MTPRQRFHAIVAGQPFDRLPILEWAGWWDKTLVRWRGEGLGDDLQDGYDIKDHLGLDPYRQWWVPPRRRTCPEPRSHGAALIRSHEDYEALRPHLYPSIDDDEGSLQRWRQWVQRQQRGEAVLWMTLEGFFWFPRTLLGIEGHMYAFYDQPDLLHRINDDLAAWHEHVIDRICAIGAPDFMTFAEDMSYNHGPMLSGDQFDAFLLPYYRRIVSTLDARGIVTLVDTDGDVTRAAPWYERAGVGGILPLERQAGVDVSVLQRNHPGMCFIGHFDKMTMSRGEAAMRAEFERLLPMAARGRFLISCDHQTPPEVSWTDYQVYLGLFREYADRAGQLSRERPRGVLAGAAACG